MADVVQDPVVDSIDPEVGRLTIAYDLLRVLTHGDTASQQLHARSRPTLQALKHMYSPMLCNTVRCCVGNLGTTWRVTELMNPFILLASS